jgi:hypothetical protein
MSPALWSTTDRVTRPHSYVPFLCSCSKDCVDCARDGESEPATWECHEAKCDLKALCDAHIIAHRKRGHPVGVLTVEGGPPSDAMLGATHCPKPEHAGADGALTHYCGSCKLLVCMRCGMDDHVRIRHSVEPVDAAAVAAAPGTKASLDAAATAHTRLCSSTAQLRSAILELQVNLASAEAAVETNFNRVLAQLNAARHSLLAEVRDAYTSKLASLTASLTLARGAVGELATVCRVGKIAAASSSPVLQLHAAHTVAASKGAVELASPVVQDTTLEVVVDGTKPVFPLGSVNTSALDVSRCSLSWCDRAGDAAVVAPGSIISAELRLCRRDGRMADVAPARVAGVVTARAVGGAGVGAGAGPGNSDSAPVVTVTYVSPGVFYLFATPPASAAGGGAFALLAVVSGVGDVGKPLMVTVRPSLLFDPAAGVNRSISADGTTVTYNGKGQLFRGRTCVLHCGAGTALDIGVEVRGQGGLISVALGGVDRIADNTYDYTNNTGLAFFLELYRGAVNQPWGTQEPGRPTLQSPGTRVLHFRVRGTTLTFRAGESVLTLKDQAGSWQLPTDFYLLFAGHKADSIVRLFSMA